MKYNNNERNVLNQIKSMVGQSKLQFFKTNKKEKNHCQNCDLFTKYQTDNHGQKIMRQVRLERRGRIKGTDF